MLFFFLTAGGSFANTQKDKLHNTNKNQTYDESSVTYIINSIKEYAENLVGRTEVFYKELDILPMTLNRMYLNLTDLEGHGKMLLGLYAFIVMMIIGAIAATAFYFPLKIRCIKSQWVKGGEFLQSTVEFLLSLLAIVIFFIFAFATSFVFFEQYDPMRLFATTYLIAVVTLLLAKNMLKLAFSVRVKNKREKNNVLYQSLYKQLVVFIAVTSFIFYTTSLLQLIGLPPILVDVLKIIYAFVLVAYSAIIVLCFKTVFIKSFLGVSSTIKMSLLSKKKKFIELGIPYFLVGFLYCFWFVWSVNQYTANYDHVSAAQLSLYFILFIPISNMFLGAAYNYFYDKEVIKKILAGTEHIVIFSLLLLSLFCFLEAMGVPLFYYTSTPLGAKISNASIQIVAISLVSYALWMVVKNMIDVYLQSQRDIRKNNQNETSVGEDGRPIVVKTRAETLLPLLRISLFFLVVSIFAMVVLSALGIDIGPLLAGAGVVGIAIGFGAQALVKDIVSGIFFLIDDAFRVGEYIEMGDIRGEVEKISLRSMQLRHHRGAIHTVPFGELRSITNYNRDWTIYKQEIRVPYDTNLEKVRKIIKKIGKSLMKDPEVGGLFIQPLKSQGVRRIEDSALILGTKFMCKPREQFYLRRLVYQRIQEAFAKEGIDFAYRKVEVKLNDNEEISKEALAASADDFDLNKMNKEKDIK